MATVTTRSRTRAQPHPDPPAASGTRVPSITPSDLTSNNPDNHRHSVTPIPEPTPENFPINANPGDPDDDGPGDGPDQDPEDDVPEGHSDRDPNEGNLALALRQLSRAIGGRDKPRRTAKPNKPDTFDGKDPNKLNQFILQCKINFRDNSECFRSDSDKVNFVLSFLRGTALQWFEPSLLEDVYEPWMDSWPAFLSELRTNFGTIDPIGDAEEELDHLRMKDTHNILRYNVEFNRLAAHVQWGDSALCHRYYKGLPDRIKDILSQQPKIKDLVKLKATVQTIDARYWERNRERSRIEKTSAHPDRTSDSSKKFKSNGDKSSSTNTSSPAKSHTPGQPDKNRNGNSNGSSSSKTSSSAPKKPDLSAKLGKDGKLNSDERKRRMDNNLCMFCGGAGHRASDCNKPGSSASKTKARASKTDKASSSDPPKDSEN